MKLLEKAHNGFSNHKFQTHFARDNLVDTSVLDTNRICIKLCLHHNSQSVICVQSTSTWPTLWHLRNIPGFTARLLVPKHAEQEFSAEIDSQIRLRKAPIQIWVISETANLVSFYLQMKPGKGRIIFHAHATELSVKYFSLQILLQNLLQLCREALPSFSFH